MSRVPANALDAHFIRELYKEVKDNRTLKGDLLAFLERKISSGDICGVDEFMEAADSNETLIIRFFRKMDQLNPKHFHHNELLLVDMRKGLRMVNRSLRDFLLWNQGIPHHVLASNVPVGPIMSGPMAKVREAPPPMPIAPPPAASVGSSSIPTPIISHAMPSVARISVPAGAKLATPISGGSPPISSLVQPAKIQPTTLWQHATLPTPPGKGTVPDPAGGSSTNVAAVPSSAGSAAGIKRPAQQSTSPIKLRVVMGHQQSSTPSTRPIEVVELLDDDDDLDIAAMADSFELGAASAASSMPTTQHSSNSTITKHSKKKKVTATAAMVSSTKYPVQHTGAPPSFSQQPSYGPGSNPVAASSPLPQDSLAKSLALRFRIDVNFAEKALQESHHNISIAIQKMQQYSVDMEEARLMDQARLQSEDTAKQDKARAAQERDARLSTPQALNEFVDSELLKHLETLRQLVAKATGTIIDQAEKDLRKACINLLDQEKKAIRWYKESARAYMRSRAKTLQDRFNLATVSVELGELTTVLYSTASERGAPIAFLAAFDAEATGGGVQPGVILGLSSDAPIELS